ncbi:organic cation transporter protein-like [Convolutriloba macropyga]|uniref:organic cation transporter protein-like n=1 Tax=Convolutriloba macropyga TaxID=536237 RepID=UPI003F526208
MGYEDALKRAGSDGIYQKAFTVFGAFACIVPLMQNLASIFTLKMHPFKCDYGNGSLAPQADSCSNCPKYVFEPEEGFEGGYSIRNHFLLVCDQEYLGEFGNTFFFIGLAIAGALGGVFADHYGRRPLGLVSTFIMTVGGIAAPFMPNFWLYTACRAVIGLGIPGLYNGIFTLLFETLDTEKRSDYYILIIQGWSSAVLFTALFGYLFPDFRHYEIAMGIATIPVVLACVILPESPRWLWVMGRKKKALASLNKIAKWNRNEPLTMPQLVSLMGKEELDVRKSIKIKATDDVVQETKKGEKKGGTEGAAGIMELFRYKYILLATVVTWFNWFSVSMCYYGWSLMVGDLGGSIYESLIYGGALEIGGRFVILFLASRVGRRPFSIVLLWTVTVCSTAAAVLVEMGMIDSIPLMVMGMLGRSFISWSWDILGLIMAEYPPTPVRVIISGTTSTWSRIGGIVSAQFTTIGRWNPNGPHYLIIGITFVAGLSCFIYPETQGLTLSDCMDESDTFIKENFGCGRKSEPNDTEAQKVTMKKLQDKQDEEDDDESC